MFQSSSSRRDVLKASAALAGVGATTAIAGCQGGNPLGGGGGGGGGGDGGGGQTGESTPSSSADPSTRSSLVPSKANGVFHVDIEMMRTNQQLERLFNAGVEQGSGAQSFDEALEQEGIEGIDPTKIYDMIGFGEVPQDMSMMGASSGSGTSYGGVVVFTGIASSTAIQAMKDQPDVSFTEETYEGKTVLKSSNQENSYLGVVSEGVYVGGTEQAVKDTIDVATGSGSAISGTVETALTNARQGAVRFAFELPESDSSGSTGGSMGGQMTQKIEVVSGTMLYQTGSNVGLEVTLTMQAGEAASQFSQQMNFFLQSYKQRAKEQPQGQQLVRVLENVSISNSGETVTINYEDSVDNLVAMAEGEGLPGGSF